MGIMEGVVKETISQMMIPGSVLGVGVLLLI